jgi:hypothetical protein
MLRMPELDSASAELIRARRLNPRPRLPTDRRDDHCVRRHVGFLQRLTNLFARTHCRADFLIRCREAATRGGRRDEHRYGAADRDCDVRGGLCFESVGYGTESVPPRQSAQRYPGTPPHLTEFCTRIKEGVGPVRARRRTRLRRSGSLRQRRVAVCRRDCRGNLVGRARALAQDGPELLLERRQRCHQRCGIERARSPVGEVVRWVVRKMRPVCLSVQHRTAPWQMSDRASFIAPLRLRAG